jgi:hypothetical protein
LTNDRLEKALEETWKNKEKFYEDTKGLSMLEILKGIENKYKKSGTTPDYAVGASTTRDTKKHLRNMMTVS